MRTLRHRGAFHAHDPRADFWRGHCRLFLIIDGVHAARGVGGGAGRIQDPRSPDRAAWRFKFEIEIVNQRGVRVEGCFIIIPRQAHLQRRGAGRHDHVKHIDAASGDAVLAEGPPRNQIDRRLNIDLAKAPLIIGAGIAEVVGGLHQNGLGGGRPEVAAGAVHGPVVLEHQREAAADGRRGHGCAAHDGVGVRRAVVGGLDAAVAGGLAAARHDNGLDAPVLRRPPRAERRHGAVVGIGCADMNGVLGGRGRRDGTVGIAARAGLVALITHRPGGDVFVAHPYHGVAAPDDLIDQDIRCAIFAHQQRAAHGIVGIDVGA